MSTLAMIQRLWDHVVWADHVVSRVLTSLDDPPAEAWREYAHILGAEEVWLSRLTGHEARAQVWPVLTRDDALMLREAVRTGYASLLARSSDATLDAFCTYRNSAGKEFTNQVSDIFMHVALHGQYHRGKINLLLRQQGREPAAMDFIAFIRGAPAAVTPRA